MRQSRTPGTPGNETAGAPEGGGNLLVPSIRAGLCAQQPSLIIIAVRLRAVRDTELGGC